MTRHDLILFLLLCMPAGAAAQTAPVVWAPAEKQWSVSVGAGVIGTSLAFGLWSGDRQIEIARRGPGGLTIGLAAHRSNLGEHYGWWAATERRATMIEPFISRSVGRFVRIGAGPVLAWTDIGEDHHKSFRTGAVLLASFETRLRGPLYFGATATFRWIPQVTIPAYTRVYASLYSQTIPESRVPLSHGSVVTSLGVRF